jgi:Mrp family chromosome partitioning ATPase
MILSLPDTTILASEIEETLLVHDIKLVNRDTISTAKRILEKSNTNILGIIFNNIDLQNTRYDYYPYEDDDQTMTSQKLLVKAS